MNTLNLTIPLTIPQLAELIRTQFSAEERRQLAELVQEPKLAESQNEEPFSIANDLREAFEEVKQARRGQKQFRSLTDVLDELQG